jgi:hypothetical protein
MDYRKIYDSLIERGKNRSLDDYYETHHILPRCMGGSDSEENLVKLTPEEHYLAHQLLVKIYPNNHALAKAAVMMIPNRPSNKMYGWIKRRFSKAQSISQSGKGNSQYGKIWITNGIEETKTSSKIPVGWWNGRLISHKTKIKNENLKKQREEKKQRDLQNKIDSLRKLYDIYVIHGFEGVKESGYEYSKPNLVGAFAKYLPEFKPQNGKKRKV